MRPEERIGKAFGPYRVEAVIGRGGMGVVYLAQHADLERKVALKLLADDLAEDASFRARFVRESRMAAAIDHPNILPIYEAGELDGVSFIAMRFVDGTDLARRLHADPLDPREAVPILVQVAAALDAAHARGLIHRDVKPANVLIAAAGGTEGADHAYLADFGLTKRGGSHSDVTVAGAFAGTLAYVAPEQVEGRDVNGRADQYSLACMAFECLTGRVPFIRDSDIAVAMAHLRDPVPSAVELRPELPSAVNAVLARGMAKDREARYRDCATLVSELRSALDITRSGVVSQPTVLSPARSRRSLVPALVVLVVIAAAALGVAVASGGLGSATAGPTDVPAASDAAAVSPSGSAASASGAAPSAPAAPTADPNASRPLPAGVYANDTFDPALELTLGDGWFLHNSYDDAVSLIREDNEDEAIDFTHVQVVYPAGCPGPTTLVGRTSDEVIRWIQEHPNLAAGYPQPVNVAGISGLSIDAVIDKGGGMGCANEDNPDGEYVWLFPVGGREATGGDLVGAWTGTRLRFLVLEIDGKATTIIVRAPGDTYDAFLRQAAAVLATLQLRSAP
jgi:serine/threonine-protein kinase